jgi:hypothetical protein
MAGTCEPEVDSPLLCALAALNENQRKSATAKVNLNFKFPSSFVARAVTILLFRMTARQVLCAASKVAKRSKVLFQKVAHLLEPEAGIRYFDLQ